MGGGFFFFFAFRVPQIGCRMNWCSLGFDCDVVKICKKKKKKIKEKNDTPFFSLLFSLLPFVLIAVPFVRWYQTAAESHWCPNRSQSFSSQPTNIHERKSNVCVSEKRKSVYCFLSFTLWMSFCESTQEGSQLPLVLWACRCSRVIPTANGC